MRAGILNGNNREHCLIVSCTMHFTSWREKCQGVQLGVDSECQLNIRTYEPCTHYDSGTEYEYKQAI